MSYNDVDNDVAVVLVHTQAEPVLSGIVIIHAGLCAVYHI